MGGQDKRDHPEVPDLDLPIRGSASTPAKAGSPTPAGPHPPAARFDSMSDDFGGLSIERDSRDPHETSSRRSLSGSTPMASPQHGPAKQIAIDVGGGDFGFDDVEIERGGSAFVQPTTSQPPSSRRASAIDIASASSPPALELAYRRVEVERPTTDRGPTASIQILAFFVPLLVGAGSATALMKLLHRRGRSVVGLLPHAFDGTSTVQSGGVSLALLVLAIALGWMGAKSRPRSYAMLGSGVMLLVASLAMVTVTLVSTEESATPPDGALLIPHVLPAAMLLLGLGLCGRGRSLFLSGGARRAATVLVAAIGGALVFAAVELSTFAARYV